MVAYLLQGLSLFVWAGEVTDLSTVYSENASTVRYVYFPACGLANLL